MPAHSPDDLPTYQKALLQVVSYRRIRIIVQSVLDAYNLNTTQWIILGLLYESEAGMRTTDIAQILEVEVPLITRLVNGFVSDGFTEKTTARQDKRVKQIRLTASGKQLVVSVEQKLASGMHKLETDLSKDQLTAYFSALHQFIKNSHPQ